MFSLRLSVLAATLFMMPLMASASKAAAATCTKGRACSAFATSSFGRNPSFFSRAGEGSVGVSAARPLMTNAFPTLSSHPWYVCMHGLWVGVGWTRGPKRLGCDAEWLTHLPRRAAELFSLPTCCTFLFCSVSNK